MTTETTRTRTTLLRELRGREHVPFIPDMEADGFPDVPEGFVLPVTAAVYEHCFELLPPVLFNDFEYVTGEGHGRLYYFWQDGRDFFCALMTEFESSEFRRFSLRRR